MRPLYRQNAAKWVGYWHWKKITLNYNGVWWVAPGFARSVNNKKEKRKKDTYLKKQRALSPVSPVIQGGAEKYFSPKFSLSENQELSDKWTVDR